MNVVKVNIGADVVRAWMRGLQEGALLESGDKPPHQIMMHHASAKVSDMARTKLSLMGASDHAGSLLQRLEEEREDLRAISIASLSV